MYVNGNEINLYNFKDNNEDRFFDIEVEKVLQSL